MEHRVRGRVVIAAALLPFLAACSSVPRLYGEDVSLHTEFLGGYQTLDHEAFEEHAVAGLDFVTRDARHGFGYELGGSYGTEEENDASGRSAEFSEFYLGLRRTWYAGNGSMRPYLGAGGTWLLVENDFDSPPDTLDEKGFGGYVHTGILWSLGDWEVERSTEVVVGIDVRGVLGDDVDYGQVALVIGFGE